MEEVATPTVDVVNLEEDEEEDKREMPRAPGKQQQLSWVKHLAPAIFTYLHPKITPAAGLLAWQKPAASGCGC